MNRRLILYIISGILLTIGAYYGIINNCKNDVRPIESVRFSQSTEEANNATESQFKEVPDKVLRILDYIDEHNRAPDGFVGGRTFHNYEKLLPQLGTKGMKINYREWDVNPKEKNKNRGAERLVTGNNRSAWYTKNHYKSFIRIR